MIISAHQPAFLPWLGYFHKVCLADIFVIMDDVQFEKNSFTNRNKILNNGKELWLTIPIKSKKHFEKKIYEIEIAENFWKKKHLKSLEQNYKSAPFFSEVMTILEEVYYIESDLLIDYTNNLFLKILDYLKISTKIIYASTLNIEGKKLAYVIELTEKLGGDVFVFGKQGEDYVDKAFMAERKIQPYFQNYIHPSYTQSTNNFVPYLSVIDLLFFYGRDGWQIIMSNNITKNELERNIKN